MKLEKKDIPKLILMVGVFVIALGLCLKFTGTTKKKPKVEWKDKVDGYQEEEQPIEGMDENPGEEITNEIDEG